MLMYFDASFHSPSYIRLLRRNVSVIERNGRLIELSAGNGEQNRNKERGLWANEFYSQSDHHISSKCCISCFEKSLTNNITLNCSEWLQSAGVGQQLPEEAPGQLGCRVQGLAGLAPEQVHWGKEVVRTLATLKFEQFETWTKYSGRYITFL